MTEESRPNPGSPAAIDQGCSCPVMDNHNGRGIGPMKDGTMMFWRSGDCPVHRKAKVNE